MIVGSTVQPDQTKSIASMVCTLPAGCSAGDSLFVVACNNLGTGNPIGFSDSGGEVLQASDDPQSNNNGYLLHRVLSASDISTGSVTISASSSGRLVAVGLVVSGLDSTTPVHDSAYVSTTGSSVNAPAISTVVDDSDVIVGTTTRVTAPNESIAVYPSQWTKDENCNNHGASGASETVTIGHLTTPGPAGSYGGLLVDTSPAADNLNVYIIATNAAASSGPTQIAPVDVTITTTLTEPDVTAPSIPPTQLQPSAITASTSTSPVTVTNRPMLLPGNLTSTANVSAPLLTFVPRLAPTAVATSTEQAALVVTEQPHLAPVSSTLTTTIGAPRLTNRPTIKATNVSTATATGQPTVTAPTLGVPKLLPGNLTLTTSISKPSVNNLPRLTLTDVVTATASSQPTILAPAIPVPMLAPGNLITTTSISRPVVHGPAARRDLRIISTTVPVSAWSTGAPVSAWSVTFPSHEDWPTGAPTSAWATAAPATKDWATTNPATKTWPVTAPSVSWSVTPPTN